MADNLTTTTTVSTIPSGSVIATDDAGAGGHVQIVKLAIATDGSSTAIPADGTNGLVVNPRPSMTRIAVTPTISTSAYTSSDSIGGGMEFTNAVTTSGGYCEIVGILVSDKDNERAEFDIVFFDQAIAGTATDNAGFDPNDADLPNIVGMVTILSGHYSAFTDNAAAYLETSIVAKCNATSLFGYMVAQATPTYTSTTDLTVTIVVKRL